MSDLVRVGIDTSAVPIETGGVGTYVRELIAHLPQTGISPVVFTRTDDAQPWPGSSEVIRVAPARRPTRLVWEQTHLAQQVADHRPNLHVLHSPHYTLPAVLPTSLPGRARFSAARVVTIHDLTFFTRPEDHHRSKQLFFRRAILRAAKQADHLIAVSPTTADLLQEFASPKCPVSVIPHGINHDRFHPAANSDDERIRSELGISGRYVLQLGTVEPRKNVSNILRAYEQLVRQSEFSDVTIVLAGIIWPGVESTLHRPTVGRVIRTGFVPDSDVAALYRGASVVTYASFEEGFGLPAIEALACGAPLVSTKDSVMDRLAGDAMLLVQPNDVDEIENAMRLALLGKGPAEALRLAAARRFTWAESANAHSAVYQNCR